VLTICQALYVEGKEAMILDSLKTVAIVFIECRTRVIVLFQLEGTVSSYNYTKSSPDLRNFLARQKTPSTLNMAIIDESDLSLGSKDFE